MRLSKLEKKLVARAGGREKRTGSASSLKLGKLFLVENHV